MFEFVALLKNQQHPTYGLGKVRTTGGSDNTNPFFLSPISSHSSHRHTQPVLTSSGQ